VGQWGNGESLECPSLVEMLALQGMLRFEVSCSKKFVDARARLEVVAPLGLGSMPCTLSKKGQLQE
jgi:hypothetical protein